MGAEPPSANISLLLVLKAKKIRQEQRVPYYVQTDVTLKWKQQEGYFDMLSKFVPYMAKQGWLLKYGLQPVVGDLRELTHIWEIDSVEAMERTLVRTLRTDPEVLKILEHMPQFTENEKIRLLMKTPYSP